MKFSVGALAATLMVSQATASSLDICQEAGITNETTAGYCGCESATIAKNPVALITCNIGESSDPFYATANATLFPCSKTAEFIVQLDAMGKNYGPFECLMGQSTNIPIPGLDQEMTIGGKQVEAQAYIEMSMKGNTCLLYTSPSPRDRG